MSKAHARRTSTTETAPEAKEAKAATAKATLASVARVKARRLDKTRPYGQIYGITGAHYEQDGLFFGVNGAQVMLRRVDPGDPESEEVGTPVVGAAAPAPAKAPASAVAFEDDENDESAPTDYNSMHPKHLKVLLEMYGEPYVDKEQACTFLRDRDAEKANTAE